MFLVALLSTKDYKPVRYEIEKAKRSLSFKFFKAVDNISEIVTILTSNPRRQGKCIPPTYNDTEGLKKTYSDRYLYGIFDGNMLVAYADVMDCGDVDILSTFIGHKDYLKFGVMYYLFDEIVRDREGLIMYDTYLGNSKGLAKFKQKLGFKSYNVIWT
jgi:hypothetical protein